MKRVESCSAIVGLAIVGLANIAFGMDDPQLRENPNFVNPCVVSFDRPPRTPHESECIAFLLGREPTLKVREFLEGLYAELPDDPWVAAALGAHRVDRRGDGAIEPLQRAAKLFRESGNVTGEAYAEVLLLRFHHRHRNYESMAAVRARLEPLLPEVEDRVVRARWVYQEAQRALDELRIDNGMLALRETIASDEFPDLPANLQRILLREAATMALALTRYSEALSLARRARETCEESRNCWDNELFLRARAIRFMAAAWMVTREEAAAITREAYERAKQRKIRWAEMLEICELGDLTDPPESLVWLQRCAELAESLQCGDMAIVARMLSIAGEAKAPSADLDAAIEAMREVSVEIRRMGMEVETISAYGHLANLQRRNAQDAGAMATLRRAIETAESYQDRLIGHQNRADALALSAPQFYGLARYLALGPVEVADPHEQAFAVLERFRVRASQAELGRAEIGGADGLSQATESRTLRLALAEAREAISSAQSRLRNATLPSEEREALLAQLEQFELREQRAILDLANADPDSLPFERPHPVSLQELQSHLAPDELFVAYQLAAIPEDGPWALLIGANATQAVALDAESVESTLGLYLGMVARRDGSEQPAAERLSASLVQPVLEALDSAPFRGSVFRRLIVVPDGRLYQLPLAAIPQRPGSAVLGERFELSQVTSATQWVELRSGHTAPLLGRALGVAGSPLRTTGTGDADDFPRVRDRGSADGRLANAGREVRRLVDRFDGAGQFLQGSAATESAVKQALQEKFGVLHFAAHAVSNHGRPSRSAVVLADERTEEDGLLQPAEIAGLDLGNTLVVLASCSSADGQRSRGGGPISLARSFVIAGSPSVIGTLWPVQDSDSARFADEFYTRLISGDSAATALSQAQRSMAAAGFPVASWAAYVLIGTGDLRLAEPLTSAEAAGGDRKRFRPRGVWGLTALLVLLALGGGFALARRFRTSRA